MEPRSANGFKMVRRLMGAALGMTALAMLLAPAAGAVNVSYTFGTGDQGWRIAQASSDTPPFQVPSFNPAGFISGTDSGAETGCPSDPCELFYFVSPGAPATLAANYGGSLSFDIASSTAPGYLGVAYIDSVVDTNPELGRTFTVPASGFGRVTLPLTQAGWLYCVYNPAYTCSPATEQQFRSVLATARFTDILADVVNGTGETYSLDNVTVSEAPPAAPAAPAKAKKKKCKKAKKKKGKKKKRKCKKKKCKKKTKKKCKKRKKGKRSRALAAGRTHSGPVRARP